MGLCTTSTRISPCQCPSVFNNALLSKYRGLSYICQLPGPNRKCQLLLPAGTCRTTLSTEHEAHDDHTIEGDSQLKKVGQMVDLKKWRRHPDLNRRITVLQTAALPLGYAAAKTPVNKSENPKSPGTSDYPPYGSRSNAFMERETGFEPATSTLARLHSTAELFPHCVFYIIQNRASCQTFNASGKEKSSPPGARGTGWALTAVG